MSKEIIINPSLLSANFYNLEKDIEILHNNDIKYLHLDVMDGMFVPNISFGIPVIKSIKENNSNFILDTHLMINEPHRYIDNFIEAGSDIITIHLEAESEIKKTLEYIKSKNIKTAISINPETDINRIYDYIYFVDMVLIMSVHPGFGGQKFIESSIDKILHLYKFINDNKLNIDIEVDGGININNINKVVDAGANIIVMGNSIFNGNIEKNIIELKNIVNTRRNYE